MDLSIIIVNWNTRDLLAQCLVSISKNPPLCEYEIWVVDNTSTDGSVPMLKEKFPHVQLIENQQNVGFAKANNQAIQKSQGRYVLLLNPDTEIKAGALKILIRFMETHPEAGATGPLTLNPDKSLQTSSYPTPTLSRELWRLLHLDGIWSYGSYKMQNWCRENPREVEALLGACLLLRKTALNQVGTLDEDYFIYSEEIDLCYRLQQGRWKLYWIPDAVITHYGGQSTKQVAAEMFVQLYRSKLLYFRKHYGLPAALTYKFILLITSAIRVVFSPLARFNQPHRRKKIQALAANYRRLISELPSM